MGAASLRISSQSVRAGGSGGCCDVGGAGSGSCGEAGGAGSGAAGVSGTGVSVTSVEVTGSGRGELVGVMVGVFGVVMFDVAKLGVEIGGKGAIMSRRMGVMLKFLRNFVADLLCVAERMPPTWFKQYVIQWKKRQSSRLSFFFSCSAGIHAADRMLRSEQIRTTLIIWDAPM